MIQVLEVFLDVRCQPAVDELNALDAETTGSRISAVEINRLYSMKSALNLVRTQIANRIRNNAKG